MLGTNAIKADSLFGYIQERAGATPDAEMVVDENGRRVSFAEYLQMCETTAAGLAEMGISSGSVVSWQLPTWIESIVLVGALSRLGAVQNPLLHIYRDREVGFALQQAKADFAFCPSTWRGFDFEEMTRRLAPSNCQVVVCDRILPQGDASTLSPYESRPNEMRWLFYTSGTTAEPKGAKHTDSTIEAASAAMVGCLQLGRDDRSALVFPFTHIGGINWLFACLMTGCTLIAAEAFHPTETAGLLARENVTLAGSGTPFHMAYLAAQRKLPEGEKLFEMVRGFPGGGAPKPPALHYDIVKEMGGVGIVSGYGLTECPILAMASVDDDDDALATSEGRPTPGVELKVVTLEGQLSEPGDGREGELRVKAPQLFLGYMDETLNAKAFDEDGYFRTGDLGRQDERGYVVITGRLKDVIIRKGENISAKEIEDLLFTHPKIADVAVIGLPDPNSGERACAVVALKSSDEALDLRDIIEFCKVSGLMTQKIPEQLEVVEALPRNPAGKVLKQDLKARFTPAD